MSMQIRCIKIERVDGLPGSGKSTLAKEMAAEGFEHFEADMFFLVEGAYSYDASRIRDAHAWCQGSTRRALAQGRRVVVSNTFTRLQELQPYLSMSRNVRIIEAKGQWGNIHGVPPAVLESMARRWEALPRSDSTCGLRPESTVSPQNAPRPERSCEAIRVAATTTGAATRRN